jgi:hypothetical protein
MLLVEVDVEGLLDRLRAYEPSVVEKWLTRART